MLGKYHQDRNAFKQIFERRFMGNDEILCKKPAQSNGPVPEPEMGLFERVSAECTCGKCYTLFGRNDRVPWRSQGNGKYINAKHGQVTVAMHCKLFRASMSGYIYLTRAEEASGVAATKQRLEVSRLESEIEEKRTKTRREQQAAELKLKSERQAAEHERQAKLQKMRNELRNREERLATLEKEDEEQQFEWRTTRVSKLESWKQQGNYTVNVGRTKFVYFKVVDTPGEMNGWQTSYQHSDDYYDRTHQQHWPYLFTKHAEKKRVMSNIADQKKSIALIEAT
jgi:hypothetical protein